MRKLVNTETISIADSLRQRFLAAQPFPHFVADNFLDHEFAGKLLASFPPFEKENAIAEHGRVGGKATRENLRDLGEPFRELDAYFSSPEFLSWMSRVTGIPDLLYDADYFGGGTHENLNGQDMSVHIDFNYHPTRGWHRRLNALIYLNPVWQEEWGGALELWKNPWDAPSKNSIAKISPLFNRLVVFPTTENSWHGFETVKIPESELPKLHGRRSIALYLYTKERPAAETGSMHSTIYYERPLPESILPDKTLSKADWDELQRLTARRDGLLEMIYSREGKFNSLISDLNQKILEQERILQGLEATGVPLPTGAPSPKTESPAKEQITISPLQFWPSDSSEHTAVSGAWRIKDFTAGMKVKVLRDFLPRPGTFVLIRIRDSDHLQLVYLAREFQTFFLAHQAASPGSLLVPTGAIFGEVIEAKSAVGRRIQLPLSLKTRFRALALAWTFLIVHIAKNILLGRVRGRWIWNLSVAYRRVLKALGIHVPVLPPSRL